MTLFGIVPEYPGAVGSMMEDRHRSDAEGNEVVSGEPLVGRDSGGVVGREVERLVLVSDAQIKKNNRLFLLVQVHGRWMQKRAAMAQTTTMAVENMGKSSRGICDVCSTPGVMLRVNHGKNMCTTCQSIYAHVFNRLPILATVLNQSGKLDETIKLIADEIGRQALLQAVCPHLPEQVAVNIENDTLDKIAEVVGYKGESGEGLIEAVRNIAAWPETAGDAARLWEIANELGLDVEHATSDDVFQAVRELVGYQEERQRHGAFLVILRGILGCSVGPVDELLDKVRSLAAGQQHSISAQPELVKALFGDDRIIGQSIADTASMQTAAQFEDLQRKVAVICRHCGVATVDEAIKHVAHAEAILDDLSILVGDYAQSPSDISLLIEKQGEELLNMRTNLQAKQDHISVVSSQVADVEQRWLAAEQVFTKILEVIGADGVANGDLPAAIEQFFYAGDSFPILQAKVGCVSSMDGHLLDIALDAMRGKITGLDPDRIAMLRFCPRKVNGSTMESYECQEWCKRYRIKSECFDCNRYPADPEDGRIVDAGAHPSTPKQSGLF